MCQVTFEALLGEAGCCGRLPSLAPPASGLIPLDTSYGPDVFLTSVHFCILSTWAYWSDYPWMPSLVCFQLICPNGDFIFPHSWAPLEVFTHISIHSVTLKFTHHVANPDMLSFVVSPLSIFFPICQPVSSRSSLFCR